MANQLEMVKLTEEARYLLREKDAEIESLRAAMVWTNTFGWVSRDKPPLWAETPPDSDRKYLGMYGGIAVYQNECLSPGVVQLRNPDGEILATIHNVKQIDSRGR